MYDVIIYKSFSNDEFLSWEIDESEYEAQSFFFRVEHSLKLEFVPQVGMRLNFGQSNVLVDTLTYCTEKNIFIIEQTQSVKDREVAITLVERLIKVGWTLEKY